MELLLLSALGVAGKPPSLHLLARAVLAEGAEEEEEAGVTLEAAAGGGCGRRPHLRLAADVGGAAGSAASRGDAD